MSLAIIMLLAATTLAILTTVNTSITVSRHSRDYLFARQNLDAAIGSATTAINTLPVKLHNEGDVTHDGFSSAWDSTFEWTRTYNDPGKNLHYGGNIHAEGTFGKNTQDTDRAWRARLVGSRPTINGHPTYGITAQSAWLSTLSSEDNSTVTGTVEGDWHAYGVGKITVPPGSAVNRVISYDDTASYTGSTRFIRSNLSATLDERLLNARVTACANQGGLKRFVSSQNGPTLGAGCYYSIVIDSPTSFTGGAAPVVVYGDIDIRANLTNSSGSQLHLYTSSGTVKFQGTPAISAYVFAPNALCKTYAAATVNYTGSLACRQIQMSGTFRQAAPPLTETPLLGLPAEPTAWVTYLENPGYIDRFTP